MDRSIRFRGVARWTFSFLFFLSFVSSSAFLCPAQTEPSLWKTVGPDGGDARAFAEDPANAEHLYLGGTSSWVYESQDGGARWHRLSHIAFSPHSLDNYIVDHIIVDPEIPQRLYAAVWRDDQPDGGFFLSEDSGHTWRSIPDMAGQSIRSLAQSAADPRILVAGTLQGIFRSRDRGLHWQQISPLGSREIHEVESLAIDPRDPDVIYAGTWHLPWKTDDGGKSWKNIKRGVIDDSDVFSIIIDPHQARTVYISACSGIYKSETSGDLFHKVQGIPSTARRTRVLRQDPLHRAVVYAGTTEGLYRTEDAGRTWHRLTDSDVIINDIYLDPTHPGRLLLATDRGGVLASEDNGSSFTSSNAGFSSRKVGALLVTRAARPELLAGIVNDKIHGGVYVSADRGAGWSQLADGLDGRDVFTLSQSQDGAILAGTSHGIFRLVAQPDGTRRWQMQSDIVNHGSRIVTTRVNGRAVDRMQQFTLPPRELSTRVASLDATTDTWLAATDEGLFTSIDEGKSWQGGIGYGAEAYESVAVATGWMVAVRREGAVFSTDRGQHWDPMSLPSRIRTIHAVMIAPNGDLWLGAADGVYVSRDHGKSWFWLDRLPFHFIDDLTLDSATGKVLAGSRLDTRMLVIDEKTFLHSSVDTGYPLYRVRALGSDWFAATMQNGIIAHPAETHSTAP